MVKDLSKILILSLFCLFGQNLDGQVVSLIVSEETVTVDEGQVTVDVTVRDFVDIYGVTYSMSYDPTVINFSEIININTDFEGLTDGSFGTAADDNIAEGEMVVSFGLNPVEQSLPDDAILYSIVFDVVGDPGDVSIIEINNNYSELEVFDIDFNLYELNLDFGSVTIVGEPNDDELTITASTETVAPGGNVCVTLTADNFIEAVVGTGTILFDPLVLEYTSISNINPALADAGFSTGIFSTANSESGDIRFSWSNDDDIDIVTLPDGATVFDICFDAIGANGTMSTITLAETGGLPFTWYREIENNQNEEIPSGVINGKVTIQEEAVTFVVADLDGIMGSNLCVPVTVENFDEIVTVEMSIDYDESILDFTGVNLGNNALGLTNSAFNEDNDNFINMLWEGNGTSTDEPLTLTDGTELFQLCFDIIGDCETSGDIEVQDWEVTQDNINNVIDNVAEVNGTISVVCQPDCSIVRIDDSCAGGETGNVIVNVENACDCVWTDSDGNEVSSGSGADCNLLAVPSGDYSLAVTCPGSQPGCELDVTVGVLASIGVSGEITNASCNTKGAITVSTTGTEDYTYEWVPSQDGTASISDLEPGLYTVTVTDPNTGCTESETFEVLDEDIDLAFANMNVEDISCPGESDGSIDLEIEGGCGDLSFEWVPNVSTNNSADNLAEGTYTVTVTDSSNPAMVITMTIDVTEPDAISISEPTVVNSTGNNGSITITPQGGTEPYSYDWIGASGLPDAPMITGLAPGNYSVTITDANGCVFTSDVIIVGDDSNSEIIINGLSGNRSLLCFGDDDGSISFELVKAAGFPVSIEVSGEINRTLSVNSLGTVEIDNLRGGFYTVVATDSEGNFAELTDILVEEPDALDINVLTNDCSEGDLCDGSIEIEVEGGVSSYDYEWSNADINGESGNDLCVGSYTVLITDSNGCNAMETIRIDDCSMPEGCFEGSKVITPNGDNINDFFLISCINNAPSSLLVYDRWGQLVYENANYNNEWGGTDENGDLLNEGAYMWVLQADYGGGNTQIEKGTVTLLRSN